MHENKPFHSLLNKNFNVRRGKMMAHDCMHEHAPSHTNSFFSLKNCLIMGTGENDDPDRQEYATIYLRFHTFSNLGG